jgi:hypothetical protein
VYVFREEIPFHLLDHRVHNGEVHRLHADVEIVQQRQRLQDLVNARPFFSLAIALVLKLDAGRQLSLGRVFGRLLFVRHFRSTLLFCASGGGNQARRRAFSIQPGESRTRPSESTRLGIQTRTSAL